jgi:hypothetical protein
MTYSFPAYVPGIAAGIALVALALAVFLMVKRKAMVVAVIAFFIALLAGGLVAPMLAQDRVVLDDSKLEQTTGYWFAPTVKGFQFAEVESIAISTARDAKGREHEVWDVKLKNGDLRRIDPGDLWDMNTPDIVQRLKSKGIEVSR